MSKASLILVDDDAFTRTTLHSALTSNGYQVQTFSQASQAAEFAKTNKFLVAILDLDLGPGPSGIDLAYVLRRQLPSLGIIFLTSYSDPRLLAVGNKDLPLGSRYFIKSQLDDLKQLEAVIDQTAKFPLKKSPKTAKGELSLTAHQIEILKLLASGLSTSQIAEELEISPKSIEAAISRINSHLGVDSELKNKRVNLTNFYYRLIGKL